MATACSIKDFELSFYRYVKLNVGDAQSYVIGYGGPDRAISSSDIWAHVSFSDLNLDTGSMSFANIRLYSRLSDINDYNEEMKQMADEFRQALVNAVVQVYDFTDVGSPEIISDEHILLQNSSGIPGIETMTGNVEQSEFIQALTLSLRMKLLHNYRRGRTL